MLEEAFFASHATTTAEPVDNFAVVPTTRAIYRPRVWVWVVLAVLLALALVGASAMAWWHHAPRPPPEPTAVAAVAPESPPAAAVQLEVPADVLALVDAAEARVPAGLTQTAGALAGSWLAMVNAPFRGVRLEFDARHRHEDDRVVLVATESGEARTIYLRDHESGDTLPLPEGRYVATAVRVGAHAQYQSTGVVGDGARIVFDVGGVRVNA